MKGLIDIKGVVELNYINPLWYLLGVIIILVIILFLFYLKRRKKYHKFKLTPKEIAIRNIKNIDYSNPKSVAYTFSTDVAQFVDEDKKRKYRELEDRLLEYKYKKDVPNLDNSLKEDIKDFIKGIKWEI